MRKLTWIILMAVSVLLLVSPCVNGEYLGDTKETMRGIKTLYVMVMPFPDLEKAGITADMIKTDVELKLRLVGIKILTEEKEVQTFKSPGLSVVVESFYDEATGFFIYFARLSLQQIVSLERIPNLKCVAPTWMTGFIGLASKDKISIKIRDGIKNHVDEFLNDYLAVNPIQQPTPQGKQSEEQPTGKK